MAQRAHHIRRLIHERSTSRSRSRSGSIPKVVTTELSMVENSLMDDSTILWIQAHACDASLLSNTALPDNSLVRDHELRPQFLACMRTWKQVCGNNDSLLKLDALVSLINECGALREKTQDGEVWLSLYLMFQDYVTLALSLDVPCSAVNLEFCGLCQGRAIGGENNLVIRRSHLTPSFIQNLVFLRRLPQKPQPCIETTAAPKESALDIACVPLLCQTTEANGQGCEDMFSRWEQQARELLFDPIIRNLKSSEPVVLMLTHHIYKFAVSLFFRASLEVPRKDHFEVSMQGFRATRWILRRHGSYADVFPIFFSVPNFIKPGNDEEMTKGITDQTILRGFAREMFVSARVEPVGKCLVISTGPIHFVVDCSLQDEGCDCDGAMTLELLTFTALLEPNGSRKTPLAVQTAALKRAARQPHAVCDLDEIRFAECVLATSKQDLVRIMAEVRLEIESWCKEDEKTNHQSG